MIANPHLSLIKNCQIPDSCKVLPFVNLYDSTIGEHSLIGPFVEIGGSEIGHHTKISSHSYIPPGIVIGNHCFIAHGVKFCNDTFTKPAEYGDMAELEQQWVMKRTRVGHCVRIGSNAVIMAGIEIEDHAIVGAGAVVTRNVGRSEVVAGVPAKVIDMTSNPWESFS